MSGAVAAHAAYNGSGTQGLAVTNKIQDQEGDVMSVFWNKNDTTRQLLHGAAFIDIPTSGNGGTTTLGGNQIFTINNDIDAIGEMFLLIDASQTTGAEFKLAGSLAAIIKRVEFHVGTQIWHTLEKEDIMALNMTEMPEGVYGAYHRSIYGGYEGTGKKNTLAWGVDNNVPSTSGGVSGVVRIPTISRQVGPTMSKFTNVVENAYLVAAAPHQTVKVKVYLENKDYVGKNVFLSMNGVSPLAPPPKLDLRLFGKHIIMCNEEREQMKAMPQGLPKRVKMSQNVTHSLSDHPLESFTIDLDHFSLLASHIIITVFGTPEIANTTTGFVYPAKTSSMTNCVDEIELKLNSSSFSGTLKGSLLTASVSDMLGLYCNTQPYFGTPAKDAPKQEHVTGIYRTYVVPLASQAFSGSSVPLNRFDNIRLTMSLPTLESSSETNYTVFGRASRVSVTCVGETTALYKGGAASLAMY
jgi:hypothetical protein